MTPGARLNTELLYTTEEKHLYRRKHQGVTCDRYICNAPDKTCRVALSVTKKSPRVATKINPNTQHNHVVQETKYLKDLFMDKLKKACIDSNGYDDPSSLYSKHMAV